MHSAFSLMATPIVLAKRIKRFFIVIHAFIYNLENFIEITFGQIKNSSPNRHRQLVLFYSPLVEIRQIFLNAVLARFSDPLLLIIIYHQ